jgi:Ubiquitin-protein ligase
MGLFKKGNKSPSVNHQDPRIRAERLLKEYDHIFKCFRTHPYISVKEVFGTPPEKYHFLYRVDGLVHTGKSLESKSDHIIEITLPADYPAKEPVCKALTPIYHPNISSETIDIKQLLAPGIFLADLVVRIGELIVFQRYSIDEPLNLEASQWAARNKSILPLSSVNLQYAQPQESPDTAPVGNQSAEATEVMEPVSPGNEQKTESIIIENDSAKIKLDQEKPAASRENPKNRPVMEKVPAEDGKRTEAIIIEQETAAIQAPQRDTTASPAPVVQAPAEKTESFSKHRFYCPSCGNKNSRKANFCMYCGTRLTGKSALKNARSFFLASMIAVPVIIIGAGIGAVFLRTTNGGFLKIPFFQTSPSAPQVQKAEPAPDIDSAVVNAAKKAAAQETETAPPKVEKMITPDKPSSAVNNTASVSGQRTIVETPSAKPVKSRKSNVEAISELPVLSKRAIEKPEAQNAAPHPSMSRAGNEQQKSEKIANSLKLAKLYVGIGSYDDAIAQYLDVLMLDPANQEARDGLVKARETKKATLGK